jgi:hypothetical protein
VPVERLGSLDADGAVALLARTTGERYEVTRRLTGGETGAHEVSGPEGERLVLKWEFDPSSQAARRTAVGLTERLGARAGWPVPAQRIVDAGDCLFVLQRYLPGEPVALLTHALVDRLFELHESRLDLAASTDETRWPQSLIETLTTGGAGYCLHEPLRGHDARSAQLTERIEELGHGLSASQLPGRDIVHWDFHPGNLLAVDGQLTAVIDNDFVTVGDAAFDLVALAVTSLVTPTDPGVVKRLFREAVDVLDEPRRHAYVAHLAIRFLDWSIRKERTDEIEFWLDQAERMLRA